MGESGLGETDHGSDTFHAIRSKQRKPRAPVVAQENHNDPQRTERGVFASSVESARKQVGYGLPCAKCHLYYPADLDTCPGCHTTERVSPSADVRAQGAGLA